MKYGVDVYSAPAFPIFGFVKNLFGTFNEGAQFADRGMQVLDICAEGKRTESRTTYICWFLVYPKSKPIHSILNHLLRGYKVGMEVGDVESAMWNVSMYICASIVAGKPLKPLAVDCITYIEQMKRLKQDLILDQSLPFAQGVLNLLGDAEDPLKLSGSVMVEEDYLKMIESSESRMMSFLHLQIFKNMMCNIFGDFEQGARLALERGDEYEKKNGSPLAMVDYLHQGISLFAMARKTKEQRYTKAAKKVKKQVDLWLEKGNINVTHLISFLDAETAALEGKSDEAARLYVQAISSAASSGFLHNAALASERFADYLLKDLNENEIAGQYFQDSIKYYTDWGSDYKADMLRQDYSHLWKEEIPEDIRVSPDLANDAGNTIHDRSSRNGDDTPQSIQHSSSQGHSISSSAARAVGVSADCAFIRAITEEGYEDSGDESEAVLQPLGLRGDDEPGRGGANEDSASIDISAITTPYTKPRTRPISGVGIDNIGDTVEEGSGEESVTTEVEFTDDKTFEVPSSSANSSHSQGHHLEGEETDDAESAASDSECKNDF
jgi:tetratricopeptide (TPR) repeat protein